MKTLQECSWKEFAISDVFDVSGTITTHPSKLVAKGNTPRVTCAATNNGLDDFYTNEPTEKGGVITIDSATIGFVGYHPYDFIATDHVEKLTLKDGQKLPYLAGLFVKKAIENAVGTKYSYGYKFAQQRIKRQTILLPTTPDGTPDWQFMEDYMREVEKKLLSQALPILQERISNYKNISGGVKIDKQSWKEFAIKDVFATIQRGKRLKTDDHIAGDMPYVSSSAVDNGVDNFISNTENVRMFGDCLTLANSGSVGATFYHPYTFVASDHVTKLQSSTINKYAYLFIATIVARLGEKYGFNREINDRRISRETILLPATPAGTPDYDFMETYMREVEYRQLLNYVATKNRAVR